MLEEGGTGRDEKRSLATEAAVPLISWAENAAARLPAAAELALQDQTEAAGAEARAISD